MKIKNKHSNRWRGWIKKVYKCLFYCNTWKKFVNKGALSLCFIYSEGSGDITAPGLRVGVSILFSRMWSRGAKFKMTLMTLITKWDTKNCAVYAAILDLGKEKNFFLDWRNHNPSVDALSYLMVYSIIFDVNNNRIHF